MKVSDIDLLLNEQLKSLDANWLKRILVSIVMEHREHVRPDAKMPLLLGADTAGSTLLLVEIGRWVLPHSVQCSRAGASCLLDRLPRLPRQSL